MLRSLCIDIQRDRYVASRVKAEVSFAGAVNIQVIPSACSWP